jgi:hypothetical protein
MKSTLFGLRSRCRSVRTVRYVDGRKAKVRCGLDVGHSERHAKHVTLVEEGRTVILRWCDGEPVEPDLSVVTLAPVSR